MLGSFISNKGKKLKRMSKAPQYVKISLQESCTCKNKDGTKPIMIKLFRDTKKKITQKILFSSDESDNESENTVFDHDTSYEDKQEKIDGETDDSRGKHDIKR